MAICREKIPNSIECRFHRSFRGWSGSSATGTAGPSWRRFVMNLRLPSRRRPRSHRTAIRDPDKTPAQFRRAQLMLNYQTNAGAGVLVRFNRPSPAATWPALAPPGRYPARFRVVDRFRGRSSRRRPAPYWSRIRPRPGSPPASFPARSRSGRGRFRPRSAGCIFARHPLNSVRGALISFPGAGFRSGACFSGPAAVARSPASLPRSTLGSVSSCVAWRGVAWRGVAWRGVAWRGVAWRGVAWRVRVGAGRMRVWRVHARSAWRAHACVACMCVCVACVCVCGGRMRVRRARVHATAASADADRSPARVRPACPAPDSGSGPLVAIRGRLHVPFRYSRRHNVTFTRSLPVQCNIAPNEMVLK